MKAALSNQTSVTAPTAVNVHLFRIAIVCWVVLTLFCAVRSFIQPRAHTVYTIYMHAAENWSAGRDIYGYTPGLDVFRYGPTSAALFTFVRPLGEAWGGSLWRILGAVLAASGLAAFARHAVPRSLSHLESALLYLMVWPLLLQNMNNGQANIHLLGLLLWAMADIVRGRLWRSAIALAAAFIIKPYVLALVGLVVLIEPRLCLRLLVTLSVSLLLPFALQSSGYVMQQYQNWIRCVMADDRSQGELALAYRDAQLLSRVYLWPMAHATYQLIEIVAGLLMAGVVAYGRYLGRPRREQLATAFALGCCWMTVFGPATEMCTYLLLGPAAAIAVIFDRGIMPRIAVGLLIAACVASLFPNDWRIQALGVQPIAGLIVLGVTLRSCFGWHSRSILPTDNRIAAQSRFSLAGGGSP